MKVTYYFREYRKGVFSIEMLFQSLVTEMKNNVTPFVFTVKSNLHFKSILRAVFFQGEINHVTGDVNYLALVLRGSKTILTIHDIGHYEQSLKGWKKFLYKKLWFEWPLRKVAYITAVSEFTKQKIIDTFHIHSSKIRVIYNPVPVSYTPHDLLVSTGIFKILQIGSGTNKNIERLIEAAQGLPCELVLLRKYDEELDRKITKHGLRVTWHYNLNPIDVMQLYVQSDIVYFASTYEGFGMPIIEAQAIGRPVLTSNVASMLEVAGDGACIVDPYQVEDIRQGLEKIIFNVHYRNGLIQKGFENIKRFQIRDIAQEYINLYEEVKRNNLKRWY